MGFITKYLLLVALAGIIAIIITDRSQKKKRRSMASTSSGLESRGFIISKQIFAPGNALSLVADNINNKWAIISPRTSRVDILDYSDLIEYELLEDGESLVKGRVGSAIVGGMLFGGIGALAGASRKKKVKAMCNSMSVRIIVNNLDNPQYVIPIISSQTKTDSIIYQSAMATAQEFTSLLALIKARAETQ